MAPVFTVFRAAIVLCALTAGCEDDSTYTTGEPTMGVPDGGTGETDGSMEASAAPAESVR